MTPKDDVASDTNMKIGQNALNRLFRKVRKITLAAPNRRLLAVKEWGHPHVR